MEKRLIPTLLVVLALATSAIATPTLVGRADAASSSCDQAVEHTAFRTTEAIDAVNETGEATSTVSNTRVTVKDTTGFVKLAARNPNGYCVAYSVELSPEIVSPADLGEVESNDGNQTASWRATQNLSSGAVYTTVELTLPPGESATFAPSDVRVKSLSWTGDAKRKGGGILGDLGGLFGGDDKLEQRTYEINASSSDDVTVQLSHEGNQIEEWHATYELGGETRTVTQNANAPVYYTESGSESVTFHFNEHGKDATVEFTAEPTWTDKASYSWTGYRSGASGVSSWLPFTTLTPEVIAG